jgi:hypothetical protein
LKPLISLIFLCSTFPLFAQGNLIVKDSGGNPIGIPVSLDLRNYDQVTVFAADGTLISLYANDGRMGFTSLYGYFVSQDCTGPEYSDYHYKSLAPRLILLFGDFLPGVVARLPATPATKDVLIKSSRSPSGCGSWGDGEVRTVVPLSEYAIEDPTVYGLEVSGETGDWAFSVPLTVEVTSPDLISCSGFESCPASP